YAEIALSPRFRETYGEFLNAQMKVRAGLQREVEQYCSQLGIPTRTEIDAAHRKIVQLEREPGRLRDAMQEAAAAPASGSAESAPSQPSGKATKAKPAGKGPAKKGA